MKPISFLLGLSLCLLFSVQGIAQSTPGIVSSSQPSFTDVSSELFGSKKRRPLRERNERLATQNERLQQQIYDLEVELDRCATSGTRRQYDKRRPTYAYNLTTDFWGERRLEKEYEQLRDEHEFLRDQRDWLRDELDECRDRRYRTRDRYDDRYERGRGHDRQQHDCDCRPKPKKKKKKRYCDDD